MLEVGAGRNAGDAEGTPKTVGTAERSARELSGSRYWSTRMNRAGCRQLTGTRNFKSVLKNIR